MNGREGIAQFLTDCDVVLVKAEYLIDLHDKMTNSAPRQLNVQKAESDVAFGAMIGIHGAPSPLIVLVDVQKGSALDACGGRNVIGWALTHINGRAISQQSDIDGVSRTWRSLPLFYNVELTFIQLPARLPRRQEVPPEYLVRGHELNDYKDRDRGIFKIQHILVVSYCWQGTQEADPNGDVIRLLVEHGMFGERLRGEIFYWDLQERMQTVVSGTTAVFIDYASLYQAPGGWITKGDAQDDDRTQEQVEMFREALRFMMVLYLHDETIVARLEPLQHHCGDSYHDRGWTVCEHRCAEFKNDSSGTCVAAPKALPRHRRDVTGTVQYVQRRAPMAPSDFDAHLTRLHFSCAADHALVSQLYQNAVALKTSTLTELSLRDLPMGELQVLCRFLPLCHRLHTLDLRCWNGVLPDAVSAGELGVAICSVPSLTVLDLASCGLRDSALQELAAHLFAGVFVKRRRLVVRCMNNNVSTRLCKELAKRYNALRVNKIVNVEIVESRSGFVFRDD